MSNRKKPLADIEAIKARAVDLCRADQNYQQIKAALRAEFGISARYDEISEWTVHIRETRTPAGQCTRMNLILFPSEYDYSDTTQRLPFAHLAYTHDRTIEPWRVYRGPIIRGERPYRVIPERGEPFAIWASSLVGFMDAMRKRGILTIPYDPDEDTCTQLELIPMKVAA